MQTALKIDVPAIIVPGSKIMVIGEAPGREEQAKGLPFVGASGRVLDRCFAYAGLPRQDVSITNVVKHAPVGGFDSEHFKTTFYRAGKPTHELLDYYGLLGQEIKQASPNVIVAVGNEALQATTGLGGITNYRGSCLAGNSEVAGGRKVVPILHPSYILHGNFQDYWVTCLDFKNKIVPQSQMPELKLRQFKSFVRPSLFEVLGLLATVTDGPWSLDIETKPPVLWCIGIAQADWSFSIPLQTRGGSFWTVNEEAQIWEALQGVAGRNPNLVGHNITYDLDYLLDYGFEPSGIYMDTLVAQSVLHPELPRGLDFVVSLFTDAPYYKGRENHANDEEGLWEYNCKDAMYTLWAAEALANGLKEAGLWELYNGYINKEIGIALEMQRRGIPIQATRQRALIRAARNKMQDTQNKLDALCHRQVLLSKPSEIRELFTTLGISVSRRTDSGLESTDKDAISELIVKYPNIPHLPLIEQYKKLQKRMSSFLQPDMIRPAGNCYASWNVAGTETGRWSSSKSPKGDGINMQTVPRVVKWAVEL